MAGPTKRPLIPKVTITKDDASTYVFDPFTASYDYKLRSLRCKPPFDATGGDFALTLTSNNASNSSTNTLLNNISEGNEVLIALGKTAATDIFRGVIQSIEIVEPNKNYMDIIMHGHDFGSDILKNRVVNGKWVQKKTADGITLDATDTAVLIEQIAKDLLNQTSSYPSADITAAAQGIVVSAANFVSTNIKMAQFYAQYENLDDKLSELDAVAGTIHYVDPSKNFIQKYAGDNLSAPSTFLITDDVNDSIAASWDQTKLGYLAPGSSYIKSLEHHKRRYFGLGGDLEKIDQKQETNSSSDPTFTAGAVQWLAVRMLTTTASANIEKIGVLLSKTGSPTSDVIMTLIEDNQGSGTSSKPLGQTIIRISKPASAITGSADWHYFPVVQPINAKSLYWIVIEGNGDASNYFNWHKDAGVAYAKSISTNGTSWTTTTGTTGFAHRQYYASPLIHIHPGIGANASDKHFHEITVKRPDITVDGHMIALLIQEAATGLKRKEIVKGKVYAPDNLLQTGQAVRIRKQSSGKIVDAEFVIGDLDYVFQSGDEENTGIFYYDIQAARFTAYT